MHYREFRAMSTAILFAAEGPAEAVETGFGQAQGVIETGEKRFSRFLEDSELSQLNRSAGSWFQASPEMFDLLGEALRLHHQTLGLFDPSVLKALERAGYDRTIDEVRDRDLRPAETPLRCGRYHFSDLLLEADGRRVWLPPEMSIDLGGIAKGWIAERAARALAEWSAACIVDAGGDMFMLGLPNGQADWRIALEDPFSSEQDLAILNVKPGAIATSTTTRRRWTQAGQERHHLIDPRTGQPAMTDWVSVTAIAAHAIDAEVFAKSLLIAGSQEANRLTFNARGIEFIAVDRQKKLFGSQNSREVYHV
jgi:FAD:protein FMN transferase